MIKKEAFDIEKIAGELFDSDKCGGVLVEGALDDGLADLRSEVKRAQFHGPRRYFDVSKDMLMRYLGEVNENTQNPNFPLVYRLRDEFFDVYKAIGERANFSARALNSIGIHKFEKGTIGILRHVDDDRYVNLIAAFVLTDDSSFTVFGEKDAVLYPSAGSVVLLRAPRSDAELYLRPEHAVGVQGDDRYSIVVRENKKR